MSDGRCFAKAKPVSNSFSMPAMLYARAPRYAVCMRNMHTQKNTVFEQGWLQSAATSSPHNAILAIHFPEPGKLRSRKVVTRSKARATGKYPSWKMERMIQWESPNELHAFRLLDANPAVTRFFEQPAEIQYFLNGEMHRHYPDALVFNDDLKEFWEIKSARDALAPETVVRTQLLTETLPRFGFGYRMVIGEDLARDPRQTNVSTILRFGRSDISSVDRERLRRHLASGRAINWGDVLDDAYGKDGRNHFCRLVLEGALVFDFEQPLCRETMLHPTARRSSKPVGEV